MFSQHRSLIFGVILLVIPVGVLIQLAADGWREVGTLSTADLDGSYWTLSQFEVELLKFELAVRVAISDGNVDQARQAIDIFHHGANIARSAPRYATIIDAAGGTERLSVAWLDLAQVGLLLDAPDAELTTALPRLAQIATTVRSRIQGMRWDATFTLAQEAEVQHAAVIRSLGRLAAATLALVFFLIGPLVALLWQKREINRRNRDIVAAANRLAAIVGTALDAVIVADLNGRILEFNRAAEAMFGYDRAEVLGRPMEEVIVPDHLRAGHKEGMARYRTSGERRMIGNGRTQLTARNQSGGNFPVEVSINVTNVPDVPGGEIFVAFVRDITARLTTEAELVRSRDEARASEEAKAELLAVMSHEMRTPLNGMLGALELLKSRVYGSEINDLVRMMDVSGNVLLSHIDDVLDISRLDAGHEDVVNTAFDLRELVADIVNLHKPLAADQGNTLIYRCSSDVNFVVGDRDKVHQILINLISNAVKFTESGRIGIEMGRQGTGDVVELRVADEGIWISEADQKRIFDVFFTGGPTYKTSAGGTGLGLSITSRLVSLLGGEIEVKSVRGQGSLFSVRLHLPLADNPAENLQIKSGSPENVPGTSPLLVLLVEDNPINRHVAHGLLVQEGCRVVMAHDGVDAVQLAADTTFDVILMDISMPRMDGINAAQKIREHGASRRSRIFALTANAMPANVERLLKVGFEQVVTKPISRSRLVEVISGSSPRPTADMKGAVPLLDISTVTELERVMGQRGENSLWPKFLVQSEAVICRIIELQQGRISDSEDGVQVHRLAGSAAVLGAAAFADALSRLEQKLSEEAVCGNVDEVSEVLAVWQATRNCIASSPFTCSRTASASLLRGTR